MRAALQSDRALEARRVDGDAWLEASASSRVSVAAWAATGRTAVPAGEGFRLRRAAAAGLAPPASAAVAVLLLCRLLPGGCCGGCLGTKKYCQANSTQIDRTMARMKLRLFSSMSLSLLAAGCAVEWQRPKGPVGRLSALSRASAPDGPWSAPVQGPW